MTYIDISSILISVALRVLAMKKKICHTSLDIFIIEQMEGIKALSVLFEKIHETTKNPDVKALSKLGTKFCKELYTDCRNCAGVLSVIKDMLDQFFQDADKC